MTVRNLGVGERSRSLGLRLRQSARSSAISALPFGERADAAVAALGRARLPTRPLRSSRARLRDSVVRSMAMRLGQFA